MIRTFVSIPVPDTPEMDSLRRELRVAGIRPSPPEQTHITLRFIGDVQESKVKRITACAERASQGIAPFDLRVSGIGAFPNENRPSVVWLGAEPAGTLRTLADRLADELRREGIGFDAKPFRAHVTVARSRDGDVPRRIFDSHRETLFSESRVDEVLVMRSDLGPGGAKHTVLARVPLRE